MLVSSPGGYFSIGFKRQLFEFLQQTFTFVRFRSVLHICCLNIHNRLYTSGNLAHWRSQVNKEVSQMNETLVLQPSQMLQGGYPHRCYKAKYK